MSSCQAIVSSMLFPVLSLLFEFSGFYAVCSDFFLILYLQLTGCINVKWTVYNGSCSCHKFLSLPLFWGILFSIKSPFVLNIWLSNSSNFTLLRWVWPGTLYMYILISEISWTLFYIGIFDNKFFFMFFHLLSSLIVCKITYPCAPCALNCMH